MSDNYAVSEGPCKKKKRNTNYCSVPQCSQYLQAGISMHFFPKDANFKAKWEAALKMGKPASTAMRVCSKHFLASDYFPSKGLRHRLFPYAVPTQNLPHRLHDSGETLLNRELRLARQERAEKRKERDFSNKSNTLMQSASSISTEDEDQYQEVSNNVHTFYVSVGVQVNSLDMRNLRHEDCSGLADIISEVSVRTEKCTQVNFLPLQSDNVSAPDSKPTILSDLIDNDEKLFTFTGIHSLDLLEALTSCVEELALDATTNKKIFCQRQSDFD